MSPSLRKFMLVSVVGMVLVMATLVYFYLQLSRKNLEDNFSAHNQVLAMVLRNSLMRDGLEDLLNNDPESVDAQVLNRIERKLKAEVPGLKWCFIEPDVTD